MDTLNDIISELKWGNIDPVVAHDRVLKLFLPPNNINLFQDYTAELSMIDINNPDFENTSKVHDWRNYVPYEWQKNWKELTERERQIIVVMAQSEADQEEWD